MWTTIHKYKIIFYMWFGFTSGISVIIETIYMTLRINDLFFEKYKSLSDKKDFKISSDYWYNNSDYCKNSVYTLNYNHASKKCNIYHVIFNAFSHHFCTHMDSGSTFKSSFKCSFDVPNWWWKYHRNIAIHWRFKFMLRSMRA